MTKTINGAVLMIILLVAIAGCKKPTTIGSDLLPPEDALDLLVSDTFSFSTSLLREDSVVSSENINYALGSMDDATFGKTTASIYTQVNLPTNNLDLKAGGTGLVADSLVLILPIAEFYGDSTETQAFNVYRIESSSEFYDDTTYYSNQTFNKNDWLGRVTVDIKPNSPVALANGDTVVPQIRIPLSPTFASELIGYDPNSEFASDDAFKNAIRGLLIEPDTLIGFGKGYAQIDLFSAGGVLRLYYKNDFDTTSFDFTITTSSAAVNSFTHNYSSASVGSLIGTDVNTGYIQGGGGLKTFIQFPGLDQLDSVLINKAEFTFTIIDDAEDGTYTPPAQILLVRPDSNGANYFIPGFYISLKDQILFSETTYGGQLNGTTYTFNIALHIQDVIDGVEDNDGLYITTFPFHRKSERVIIGGADHPTFPAKLNLIYTKTE